MDDVHELLTLDELDRAGRHERAQRPLLHHQGPGAAADPARPLRLLHPPTTWPGSSWCRSCRATASRSRRSRSTSPASPPTPRPRTSRCTARCWRPGSVERADRDVARRARHARRPRRSPTTTCARWPRSAWSSRCKRGRYQVAVSQLSVGLGLLDLGFPTEAALAAADVYAAHGRADRRGALRACSAPWSGRSTRSPGASPETGAPGRGAAQAALDRQPGLGLRERGMDETKREGIARRSR